MNKEIINVTNLMKLNESLATYVDEVALVDEVENLCRYVRIFGLKNVRVYYVTESKTTVLTASQLPERMRCMAVMILILMGHSVTYGIFGIKEEKVKTLFKMAREVEIPLSVKDFLEMLQK